MSGPQEATKIRCPDTDDAGRTHDPPAEAQRDHGRAQEARQARKGLIRPLSRLVHQVEEHRTAVVPAVPAPRVLVAVALQPLSRDAVVRGLDPVLEQTEEPVNGLCVNVGLYVDARRVVNPAMTI